MRIFRNETCVRLTAGAIVMSCVCLVSSCTRPDSITEFTNQIDDTVDSLSEQSENWQALLEDLIKKVPKEVQGTIRNELQNLVNVSIAVTGSEIRCDLDFVINRLKMGLLRIKALMLNQAPPRLTPALCQVIPLAIDRTLVPARLLHVSMYGYNLTSNSNIRAFVNDSPNNIREVSSALDYPTHYSMTLKFGANGAALNPQSERIVLKIADQELSSIGIVQPDTPTCESKTIPVTPNPEEYIPPKVKGDGEFNGNGPHIWATVRLIVKPRRLDAEIYMRAKETGDPWRGEPSEAKGTKEVTLYTPDPGWKIESVVDQNSSHFSYIDPDENLDSKPGGSGPVKRWLFQGDTQGSDIGKTSVKVTFNTLRIVVTQSINCVSEHQTNDLVSRSYIGDVLKYRLKKAFTKR